MLIKRLLRLEDLGETLSELAQRLDVTEQAAVLTERFHFACELEDLTEDEFKQIGVAYGLRRFLQSALRAQIKRNIDDFLLFVRDRIPALEQRLVQLQLYRLEDLSQIPNELLEMKQELLELLEDFKSNSTSQEWSIPINLGGEFLACGAGDTLYLACATSNPNANSIASPRNSTENASAAQSIVQAGSGIRLLQYDTANRAIVDDRNLVDNKYSMSTLCKLVPVSMIVGNQAQLSDLILFGFQQNYLRCVSLKHPDLGAGYFSNVRRDTNVLFAQQTQTLVGYEYEKRFVIESVYDCKPSGERCSIDLAIDGKDCTALAMSISITSSLVEIWVAPIDRTPIVHLFSWIERPERKMTLRLFDGPLHPIGAKVRSHLFCEEYIQDNSRKDNHVSVLPSGEAGAMMISLWQSMDERVKQKEPVPSFFFCDYQTAPCQVVLMTSNCSDNPKNPLMLLSQLDDQLRVREINLYTVREIAHRESDPPAYPPAPELVEDPIPESAGCITETIEGALNANLIVDRASSSLLCAIAPLIVRCIASSNGSECAQRTINALQRRAQEGNEEALRVAFWLADGANVLTDFAAQCKHRLQRTANFFAHAGLIALSSDAKPLAFKKSFLNMDMLDPFASNEHYIRSVYLEKQTNLELVHAVLVCEKHNQRSQRCCVMFSEAVVQNSVNLRTVYRIFNALWHHDFKHRHPSKRAPFVDFLGAVAVGGVLLAEEHEYNQSALQLDDEVFRASVVGAIAANLVFKTQQSFFSVNSMKSFIQGNTR